MIEFVYTRRKRQGSPGFPITLHRSDCHHVAGRTAYPLNMGDAFNWTRRGASRRRRTCGHCMRDLVALGHDYTAFVEATFRQELLDAERSRVDEDRVGSDVERIRNQYEARRVGGIAEDLAALTASR